MSEAIAGNRLAKFFSEGVRPEDSWAGLGKKQNFSSLPVIKKAEIKRKKGASYEDLRLLPSLFSYFLVQQLELSNLKKEFYEFKDKFSSLVDKKLDFGEEVKMSSALQTFVENRILSDAAKKIILKNKEKIEKLYKDGEFQSDIYKIKGMIEIKDIKRGEEFLE